MRKNAPGKNIVVSPLSVATALLLLDNGAGGDTRTAISRTLGVNGADLTLLNEQAAAQRESLKSSGDGMAAPQLAIANGLWADKGVQLAEPFTETARRYFAAEARSLPFKSPASADIINAWASKNTAGKIPQVIDAPALAELSGGAVLTNAVYFKAPWQSEFAESLTKLGPFTLASGRTVQVPRMHQPSGEGEYTSYLKGEGFQAVTLPYRDDRKERRVYCAFYILLPDQGSAPDALLPQLTAENWRKWRGKFGQAEVDLTLPKFTTTFDASLTPPLTALGMGGAFSPDHADLGLVGLPPRSFIARATHTVYFDVNEKGTEAAAVTTIGMGFGGPPSAVPKVNFVVDRPFLCAIVEEKTGAILFIGIIDDPRG
jgi:serpin B